MESPIPDLEQRILLEENDLLIVDKPHNIPTSGKSLDDHDALQYWLMQRHGGMVWAVHQLDADTTGVNLFVTKKKKVRLYQRALASRFSTKVYLAIVHGKPSWQSFECREPIGYVDERSLGVAAGGKSAHSVFRVIDSSGRYSLLEIQITTGRTHQIRIHLSHVGFPLVGEEWYRTPACTKHPRQALHAAKVVLLEPVRQEFVAPFAKDLKELCERCSLHIDLVQ